MAFTKTVSGAHYGLKDWLAQRITAVVMAVYTLIFLVVWLTSTPGYGGWLDMFAPFWMKVLTLLALISLAYHAWIGLRDIIMDYIKSAGLRLFLEALVILALAGYGIWAVTILWRV